MIFDFIIVLFILIIRSCGLLMMVEAACYRMSEALIMHITFIYLFDLVIMVIAVTSIMSC